MAAYYGSSPNHSVGPGVRVFVDGVELLVKDWEVRFDRAEDYYDVFLGEEPPPISYVRRYHQEVKITATFEPSMVKTPSNPPFPPSRKGHTEVSKEEALRFLNGLEGMRYARYDEASKELKVV